MFAGRAKLPHSRLSTQWVPVHSVWFNSKFVVYSGPEALLTADVAFGSRWCKRARHGEIFELIDRTEDAKAERSEAGSTNEVDAKNRTFHMTAACRS
jgi:hypothetical protein